MSYPSEFNFYGKNDCNKNKINMKTNSGLSENDVKTMCKVLIDEDLNKYLEKTIKEQRFILIFYTFIILFFLPHNYKTILNYIKAMEMKRRKSTRFNTMQQQVDDLSV